ncbi:hypothetical protein OD91_2078 [Lutibacter sp. Hel_I_33_5]|uniref:hypothetical protein n=1 Tax=Lutibacter sp. Hel_I_33_5 TaxID=1566289 RepID=UPI0011AAA89F|nr:hypothetical protein [Lutibacter sp. Hel_I_33_5]TVZ56780.1 hypothetical protein OD91_2078 [Lutibacter sp. Hel_I_33_5]
MKKIYHILVVALIFTLSSTAQQKRKNLEPLDTEQQTTLFVKKMALALDLTDAQQRKVKPYIAEQIADKKAGKEERKRLKDSGKKLSKDERYKFQNERLDKELAFKRNMKKVLNEEQYKKFKKMKRKLGKKKRKMMKGKKMKKRKGEKRNKDNNN